MTDPDPSWPSASASELLACCDPDHLLIVRQVMQKLQLTETAIEAVRGQFAQLYEAQKGEDRVSPGQLKVRGQRTLVIMPLIVWSLPGHGFSVDGR
jgi:hypothetical protein